MLQTSGKNNKKRTRKEPTVVTWARIPQSVREYLDEWAAREERKTSGQISLIVTKAVEADRASKQAQEN